MIWLFDIFVGAASFVLGYTIRDLRETWRLFCEMEDHQ